MLDDRRHKKTYSHPEPVVSLIQEFLAEMLPGGIGWVARLDFSSLERLPTEHVSAAFRSRTSDMLWRVKVLREEGVRKWLYVLVLLEFQSVVDWLMALRVQEYAVDAYRSPELAGGKVGPGGQLPLLLAVVLYNGEPRWNAPLELAGLVAAEARPEGAADDGRAEVPRLYHGERYELIDIRRYDIAALAGGGLASQLLRWELVETRQQAAEVIVAVTKLLPRERHRELRSSFLEMVRLTGPRLGLDLSDLVEDEKMRSRLREKRLSLTLEERIRAQDRKLREEGRAEGIEQERGRGIEREHELLGLLIGQKFDRDTERRASALLAGVRDLEALEKIQSWILECAAGADLLRRVESLRKAAAP